MIGRNGERGSGISALAARHDDDKPFLQPSLGSKDSVEGLRTFSETSERQQ